ncbi:UDP-2,3-diacylglucosamine diphosphatase LpxI [Nisaea acidiphila]|uniref:UDP-2,3-diacylglucosamine diphosphatase LpxI n=1 Tax=Nisaea acidiphila TaxID=1862145 RepID=A0A9J7AV68_9PROT|nr:UDP-2,3-diacylglucosamine diphosphatase LpxI [Nisaea acidiphila]UUX50361.1 UDP-2,3-diacylglucosamine diphosphatase LpxI [Nisaea acidiphila]
MPKLGILAGGGVLPRRIAERRLESGERVFVIAFEGQTDPATVEGLEHAWMRLGATGAALKRLKEASVEEVVMAGPMRRPAFSDLTLDMRSVKALARAGRKAFGDDGLLSLIIEEIERDGFRVVGIDDVLGGYLMPAGAITESRPDENAEQDIARGLEVLAALSPADVGQAVVVQEGLVLAVEAVEGTDAMVARAGDVKRSGAPGPILVKTRKRGQERRADLPTIGVETVRGAIASGFRGIAVETGATIVIDREAVVEAADAAGLFVSGIVAAEPGEET